MTKYYHICSDRTWRYKKRSNFKEQMHLKSKISLKNNIISELKEKLKDMLVAHINYNFLKECYNTVYNNFEVLYEKYNTVIQELKDSREENEKYKTLITDVNQTLNQEIHNYEELHQKYEELKNNYEELKVKIEVN